MTDEAIETTADADAMGRRSKTPKSQRLLITLLGMYAREQPLPVSTVVAAMSLLGVAEAATRTTLSRLKARGVLVSTRTNSGSGYAIAREQLQRFSEGDQRIFEPRRAEARDWWSLATFSVPESRRHLRYQVRKVLSSRGFGTVGSALWVAPGLVYDSIRADLEREGLSDYVEFFFADYAGREDMADKVAAWWDLEPLMARYGEFCTTYAQVLDRWDGGEAEAREPEQAFVDYVTCLTSWRVFPYLEAGLPLLYLPDPWPGSLAEQIFCRLHELLADPARAFVESLAETARSRS